MYLSNNLYVIKFTPVIILMWTRSQEWTELISSMTNTHNSLSLTDSTVWRRPWEQPAHWPLAPGPLGRPYAPPASLGRPMSWWYPSDKRAPIPGQQWPLHPLPPTKSKRSVKRRWAWIASDKILYLTVCFDPEILFYENSPPQSGRCTPRFAPWPPAPVHGHCDL